MSDDEGGKEGTGRGVRSEGGGGGGGELHHGYFRSNARRRRLRDPTAAAAAAAGSHVEDTCTCCLGSLGRNEATTLKKTLLTRRTKTTV